MEKDIIFETAERYIKSTGRSVFLTGKAGTGKTTFLKYITQTTTKRFIVLAPTGVAAINAGGSTIHSFFQLPLCPYLPDVKELLTEYQTPDHYRKLRKERINIIRTLDLLIIDEISMVRADLLDAVDMTLRKYRRNSHPFGGVQLLMIGDAQQLSPVVKEHEKRYLAQVYPSPYFFHSKALQNLPYITIELQKVHRQKDDEFLEILNAIREDKADHKILEKLNRRVGATLTTDENSEPIRLTTHNAQADDINIHKLRTLPGEAAIFEAEIEGDFPPNSYPAEKSIYLKPGAQVMFIRNDSEGQFYNGKLAKVEEISEGRVTVSDSDGNLIEVTPLEWNNFQYEIDPDSGEIHQVIVGTFRQIPLRVAWAITIHKSQGLTFDNVIIDAASAFAFGQVYVALSRCRTLEGISLESPITHSGIYSDTHVSEFNTTIPSIETVKQELGTDERKYIFSQFRSIFELSSTCKSMSYLLYLWKGVLEETYPEIFSRLNTASDRLKEISKVSESFQLQLRSIEQNPHAEESYLQERLYKASTYFLPIIKEIQDSCFESVGLEIDNKETKKRVKTVLEELLTSLNIIQKTLESFNKRNFDIEHICQIRTECHLQDNTTKKKKKSKGTTTAEAAEPGTINEELKERLQQWRTEQYTANNVPAYIIMHQKTLLQIAATVPHTKAELLSVKGFGPATYEKYGEQILAICAEFSKK